MEQARAVIALLDRAEAEGSGVVLDADGRMVDAAVLHAARRTLALVGAPLVGAPLVGAPLVGAPLVGAPLAEAS